MPHQRACDRFSDRRSLYCAPRAEVAELVDALDSKSSGGDPVRVRFSLSAPGKIRRLVQDRAALPQMTDRERVRVPLALP